MSPHPDAKYRRAEQCIARHGTAMYLNAMQRDTDLILSLYPDANRITTHKENEMTTEIKLTITGTMSLLMNNPQVVDPFNKFKKEMVLITNKKKKTEDDLLHLRKLEIASKIYWEEGKGVCVPASWLIASVAAVAFKRSKISKATIRSCLTATEDYFKLSYAGMGKVKKADDIVLNEEFTKIMILKQKDVKICKAVPCFHNWSFNATLTLDEETINRKELQDLLEYSSKYVGFGDFRPTFGKAEATFN